MVIVMAIAIGCYIPGLLAEQLGLAGVIRVWAVAVAIWTILSIISKIFRWETPYFRSGGSGSVTVAGHQ